MYKSGANTVYVNTWTPYMGTKKIYSDNGEWYIDLTGKAYLHGVDINGNDFLTQHKDNPKSSSDPDNLGTRTIKITDAITNAGFGTGDFNLDDLTFAPQEITQSQTIDILFTEGKKKVYVDGKIVQGILNISANGKTITKNISMTAAGVYNNGWDESLTSATVSSLGVTKKSDADSQYYSNTIGGVKRWLIPVTIFGRVNGTKSDNTSYQSQLYTSSDQSVLDFTTIYNDIIKNSGSSRTITGLSWTESGSYDNVDATFDKGESLTNIPLPKVLNKTLYLFAYGNGYGVGRNSVDTLKTVDGTPQVFYASSGNTTDYTKILITLENNKEIKDIELPKVENKTLYLYAYDLGAAEASQRSAISLHYAKDSNGNDDYSRINVLYDKGASNTINNTLTNNIEIYPPGNSNNPNESNDTNKYFTINVNNDKSNYIKIYKDSNTIKWLSTKGTPSEGILFNITSSNRTATIDWTDKDGKALNYANNNDSIEYDPSDYTSRVYYTLTYSDGPKSTSSFWVNTYNAYKAGFDNVQIKSNEDNGIYAVKSSGEWDREVKITDKNKTLYQDNMLYGYVNILLTNNKTYTALIGITTENVPTSTGTTGKYWLISESTIQFFNDQVSDAKDSITISNTNTEYTSNGDYFSAVVKITHNGAYKWFKIDVPGSKKTGGSSTPTGGISLTDIKRVYKNNLYSYKDRNNNVYIYVGTEDNNSNNVPIDVTDIYNDGASSGGGNVSHKPRLVSWTTGYEVLVGKDYIGGGQYLYTYDIQCQGYPECGGAVGDTVTFYMRRVEVGY